MLFNVAGLWVESITLVTEHTSGENMRFVFAATCSIVWALIPCNPTGIICIANGGPKASASKATKVAVNMSNNRLHLTVAVSGLLDDISNAICFHEQR